MITITSEIIEAARAFVSANVVAETIIDPSDGETWNHDPVPSSSAWPPLTDNGEIDYFEFSWP